MKGKSCSRAINYQEWLQPLTWTPPLNLLAAHRLSFDFKLRPFLLDLTAHSTCLHLPSTSPWIKCAGLEAYPPLLVSSFSSLLVIALLQTIPAICPMPQEKLSLRTCNDGTEMAFYVWKVDQSRVMPLTHLFVGWRMRFHGIRSTMALLSLEPNGKKGGSDHPEGLPSPPPWRLTSDTFHIPKTCRDSIRKLFCACFYGVLHNYRAICCKMGCRTDVPVWN